MYLADFEIFSEPTSKISPHELSRDTKDTNLKRKEKEKEAFSFRAFLYRSLKSIVVENRYLPIPIQYQRYNTSDRKNDIDASQKTGYDASIRARNQTGRNKGQRCSICLIHCTLYIVHCVPMTENITLLPFAFRVLCLMPGHTAPIKSQWRIPRIMSRLFFRRTKVP